MSRLFTVILSLMFVILSIWSGWEPVMRSVWYIEFAPAEVIFILFLFIDSRFRFSATSRILIFAWLFWHTIGAHYTFANVPFQWFSDLLDTPRNHFDRISHFLIGLYAFPIAEWLTRTCKLTLPVALVFSLSSIMAVAAGYEIFEWIYAVFDGGENGLEILGAQGDIWDAQKDMLCDTAGAVFALILFSLIRPYKRSVHALSPTA